MFSTFKMRLVAIGSSPYVNGVAAVFSVLAGALASFFTNSIRTSLALPADPNDGNAIALAHLHWTGEAVVFWFLVILAALLFAWSKFSDGEADNKHKEFLSEKLHGLESMPPDAFLKKLEAEYIVGRAAVAQATALSNTLGGMLNPSQVDSHIQSILRAFANVASAYDGSISSSYRVYLMRFSRNSWPEEKLKRAVDFKNLAKQAQFGVLETFLSLQIIFDVDAKIKSTFEPVEDYALPVYEKVAPAEDKNVLPGAPRAFVSRRIFECESTAKMVRRLRDVVGDKNQAEAMREFYKNGVGRSVKSFISLAVPINKWVSQTVDWQGSEICAVLMIEADHENLLKSAEGFFCPVVQPLLYMLSDLLAMRSVPENVVNVNG
ncbi:hypothetical protein [Burkholderia arboris]|uniref:hypothetical protein n=1 Tax=Burkholderia arboris TaxID=488730 RepID=UPI00210ACB0C|nr:hypothetical protein [Burkholderia arboris]UTV59573.1 hypothetical protein NLX30_25990 [Burkholderia arboris]